MPFLVILLLINVAFSASLSVVDIPELRQSLNSSLNPCTDFYQFVCDGFLRRAQLRSQCAEMSNAATRKAQVQAQLEGLLRDRPPLSSTNTLVNFHIVQMFAFHNACLGWPRQALIGSEALLEHLEKVNGAAGEKAIFGTEWAIRAFPSTAFYQLTTALDTRKGRGEPERRTAAIQLKPLITDQLDRAANVDLLTNGRYMQIMRTLLNDDLLRAIKRRSVPILFSIAPNETFQREIRFCTKITGTCRMSERLRMLMETEAQRRVKNLISVERILATSVDTNPVYDQSPLGVRNFVKIGQLSSVWPPSPLNWTLYLGTVLSPVRQMNSDSKVFIEGNWPGLVQSLNSAIAQVSPQQISDYLDWQLIWPMLPQMDSRYTQAYVKIVRSKTPNGKQKCPTAKPLMRIEEKCEKFIEWHFPHLLDRLYIQRYGERSVREDIQRIYANVYSAFQRMLQKNKWLDAVSRAKALAKLNALQPNLLYFDRIFDEQHLTQIYGPYRELKTDAPFPIILRQLEGLSFLRRLSTDHFYESSWTINAFYSRESNTMIALNAYLQPPIYYGPNHPASLNMAGIGIVLGHELTHAFDDWGSFYDAEGRVGDWLGTKMRQIFQRKKQCFVEQYGRVPAYLSGEGTMYVNGSMTANENIADNGGVASAFYAWQLMNERGMGGGKVRGLEQYAGDQLFFINYAFRNCAKLGTDWLKQRVLTELHAIGPARVNVPLQNFPAFAHSFKCPQGTPMNPEWMCKIW